MATTGTPRRAAPTTPPQPPRRGKGGATRPPNGRKGRRRPKRSGPWQKIKLFFQIAAFLFLILVIAASVFLIFQLRQAPAAINLSFSPPGRTIIYSADGVVLADIHQYNRQVVPIQRIPKDLLNATVAFEDKRFYQHQGVDFKGIARSLFENLKSGNMKAEGGSTITQQLARNMKVDGLTREKTVQRKLHEWIVANQIEKNYTKQDILWMYLNYVNYGAGAFGVQAAATTYFGKDVSKLDLAQCALLAGLPNRPTDYNPYKNKPAALGQRGRVLQEMAQQHYITPAQFAKANAEPIQLAYPREPAQQSRIYAAPYFTDYVIEQLKQQYGDNAVMAGNMKVYTTLNMSMQKAAERDLDERISENSGSGSPTEGCLVAVDPKTGEIKAMVGGVDYKRSQFNIAADGRRQPGSTFKAVLYSAAIDSNAVSEDTTVLDAPQTYYSGGRAYTPKDDSYYSYRRYNLVQAMAYSVNTIAVKVLDHIGPALEVQYARRLGVESPLDPVLSLALGSSPVTPLEMAGVYETFPDGGNHAIPTAWTEIDDTTGNHVFAPQVETNVLQKGTVNQLDDMLRAVVDDPYGTGHGVEGLVPDARGKTGTTQEHKDVWFDGYTSNLVCVVWAGHPIYKKNHNGTQRFVRFDPLSGNSWGATVCAPIWAQFMHDAEPIFLQAQARERALELARDAKKHPKSAASAASAAPTPAPSNATDDTSAQNSEYGSRYHHHRWHSYANDTTTGGTDTGDTSSTSSANGSPADSSAGDAGADAGAAGAANSQSPDNSSGSTDTTDVAPSGTPVIVAPSPPLPHETPAPQPIPELHPLHVRPRYSAPPQAAAPAPPPPASKPENVTVRVNPEDGLLATQWDPEVVDRTYVKGTEPHRYSRLHPPPPGEH